jgi:hypothetical protein
MSAESDFEYEGIEADDEMYGAEADDEADDEAEYMEADDEGIEADDEADDEAEYMEADDESIEADDEADDEAEYIEADDEARVSGSARLRANQDRRRRVAYAQKMAAARKRDERRAATTQKSITRQIRSVRAGAPARVAPVATLRGAGVVTAILPNGRRTQMRIIPTVAPVAEVNRLRSVILTNEKRQAVATANNAKAITALASTQTSAVKRLTDQQLKSDKELGKRIVEINSRLDKRITKELGGGAGSMGKHGKRMMVMLRRQRQRSMWNSVLLASAAPFYAAYGKSGDPFHRNNLILTGSLLGWLVGDELIDQFSGKSSNALKSGANWWSYLAPVGNGATVYFLLKDKQHQRFISGVTDVPATGEITVSLVDVIAKDFNDDFKRDDHPAVATVLEPAGLAGTVTASVKQGNLKLMVEPDSPIGGVTKVAWIVDTEPTQVVSKLATP